MAKKMKKDIVPAVPADVEPSKVTLEEIERVANELISENPPVALTPDVGMLTVEKIDMQLKLDLESTTVPETETYYQSIENIKPSPIKDEPTVGVLGVGYYGPDHFHHTSTNFEQLSRQLEELKHMFLETENVTKDDLLTIVDETEKLVSTKLQEQADFFRHEFTVFTQTIKEQLGQVQQNVGFEVGKLPKIIALLKNDIAGLRRQVEALGLGENTEVEVVEQKFIDKEQADSPLPPTIKKAVRTFIMHPNKLGDRAVLAYILAQEMVDSAVAGAQKKDPNYSASDLAFNVVDLALYMEEIKATNEYGIVSRAIYEANGGKPECDRHIN